MIGRCTRNYALISGICMMLNTALLTAMDRAGTPLLASLVLSFSVCVVVGYVLHGRITFRRALELPAFARYVLAMSTNIPLAFVALWLWRDVGGWRIEFAAPAATLSTALVNFAICRFAVFGRRETPKSWVHS